MADVNLTDDIKNVAVVSFHFLVHNKIGTLLNFSRLLVNISTLKQLKTLTSFTQKLAGKPI